MIENKSVLFLSDIHLFGRDDSRQASLIEYLETNKDRFDILIFVGDIFDFWLGQKHVVFSAYIPFLYQLESLVKSGKKIIYFEGNHDLMMGPYFTHVLKADVYEDSAQMTLGSYKLWICHGDQTDPRDFVYRFFRWLFRTPLLKFLASIAHPDLLWFLGNRASNKSRKRNKSKFKEKRKAALLDYSTHRFEEGFDVVISGHIHSPFIKPITHNGKKRAIINIGDWLEHRSALWFRGDRFELISDIERNVAQSFAS